MGVSRPGNARFFDLFRYQHGEAAGRQFQLCGLAGAEGVCARLCALRQLNLVELARDEQASVYRAVRTTEKKDLASAPILHSLEVSR